MIKLDQDLLEKAYDAFNKRDVETVISLMHPQVHWPNGWEGGYVEGHNAVIEYWRRQWKEIDPHVTALSFTEREQGQIEVDVHQVVKDLKGNLLQDGKVRHIYTIENSLIKSMEIEKE